MAQGALELALRAVQARALEVVQARARAPVRRLRCLRNVSGENYGSDAIDGRP